MSTKITSMVKPFGQGFSALSTRLLIEDLTKRFIAGVENTIKIKAFKDKDVYFIWATIESKTNDKYNGTDNIHYDIVFQMIPPNSKSKQDLSIRDYDVKVYSNCPSFIYTFNFAYYKKNALINLPNGYYSKLALTMKPKVRNPLLLLGIDENIWFVVMYLDKHKLFDRSNIDNLCNSDGLDWKQLLKYIVSQDTKLQELKNRHLRHANEKKIQDMNKREENKKKEKENEKKNTRITGHALSSESLIGDTNALRMKSFNDLSSNITSSLKTDVRSSINKSGLKSSLKSSL